ncbi:MAG: hypothetical protein K9M75_01565 [Phycisphaerae bacterium]|nr:hypothetical protein [Phycisphaerae bacterium]
MKTLHVKDIMNRPHLPHMHMPHAPTAHEMMLKTEHLLRDPRFWAVLAMVAITALVITMAILTRPTGTTPTPVTPIFPGPYIY